MCKPVCTPWSLISGPFEQERSGKKLTCIRFGGGAAFAASLVSGLAGGFFSGLAVYNRICQGNSCTGLTDARSIITEAIPWLGFAVGGLVVPSLTIACAQLIGHCSKHRRVVQMKAAGADDRAALLANAS